MGITSEDGKKQTNTETFAPVDGSVKGTEMQTSSAKMLEKDLFIKDVAQKILDTIMSMPVYSGNLNELEMVELSRVLDIVATTYVEIALAGGDRIDTFMNMPMNEENISTMVKKMLPILESKREEIKAVINEDFAAKMARLYFEATNPATEPQPSNQPQGATVVEAATPAPAAPASQTAAPSSTMNVSDIAVLSAYFARYVAPSKKFANKEIEAEEAAKYVQAKRGDKRFILWAAEFMNLLDDYKPEVHGNNLVAKELKETASDTWTNNIFTAIFKEIPKTPGRIHQDVSDWWAGVHMFA